MAANVETMMYVREKPWHGLGVEVSEAPNSEDALRFAGLDWNVRQENVFNSRGGIIKGFKANVRDSDDSVLGVVGDRYKVVQNRDAFKFTDGLIGGDVRYETAGSLRDGKQIWLLAKLPEQQIAGDAVEPYLCFTNAHDGSSGVRVCMTPVRVVCNNTLNVALATAKRTWSMRHTENVHERLNEARDCLFRAEDYMDGLAQYADMAANKTVQDDEIREILNETGWNVLSLKDAGIDADIEENGTTFEENAKIKAEGIRNWCLENGIPRCSGISAKEIIVLADDSGLEIDWLGGEPGIYSARYMGHETSYREKNANLISRLDGVPKEKRTARFVCAIAAALPDGNSLVTRGTIEGYIGWEECGSNGFGYDPIFYLYENDKSTAELSAEEKNAISHRGKALRQMKKMLEEQK